MGFIEFSVISLNVRGMRNYKKRRKILNWLVKHGSSKAVIFLQEVHCTRDVLNVWKTQWRGKSYYSCGTYQSRGIAILIGKDIEYVKKKILLDKEGRMITLHCTIQGEHFVFINTYAPTHEIDQIEFFSMVGKALQDLNLELEEEYCIC